ncbi:MAG: hypothetical protein WC705_00495 [Candidatus Paceibacterota bacterium]|jgi:multisubunit Na+/H+ antiporter MnhG subunit
MFKFIVRFFDKLEDKIRHNLSKHPIFYALIGGFGIVLFWSGVEGLVSSSSFITPWIAIVVSVVIMLLTGTLVSFFIGEQLLISGLKEEKKTDEKTEKEIREEDLRLKKIMSNIEEIHKDVVDIKKILSKKK